MWRQVLHVAICWLTLSECFGLAVKDVKSSIVDNESAESAPHLYRSVPVGVYASRSPYAAYSFQVPAFITAPQVSASRIVPVKQQIEALHKNNGYLRDSYGNQFVDTPQMASYRSALPQQYVPLQELPAHLVQPLLAASQNKQTAPHYFVGAQYRVPTFQIATNDPRSTFGSFPRSFVYAPNVRHLVAPAAQQKQAHVVSSEPKQPTSNKLYTNAQVVEQFKYIKNEPKFDRYAYKPDEIDTRGEKSVITDQSSEDKGQIEAAAAKTPVTAIVNGKKTVINIETKPPVPLLDLSLLEPITFDNPLVPQLQHFLPRIHDAKYHSLPEYNEVNKQKKPKGVTKKKPKQKSLNHHEQLPAKPVVTVTGAAEGTPELSYEINTPNHKETYQEKSISYNRKVESKPETYSYNKKTEANPVHYSYQNTEQKEPVNYNIVYSSNRKPETITQAIPQVKIEQPRQLVYTFKADEAIDPNNDDESEAPVSAEDPGSSEVNIEDEPIRHLNHRDSQEIRNEAPTHYQNQNNEQSHNNGHRSNNYHNDEHSSDYHHNPRYNRYDTHRQHNDHHKNHQHHHNDHHDNHHVDHRHSGKIYNDRQHNRAESSEHRENEHNHEVDEDDISSTKQYRSQKGEYHKNPNQQYHPEPSQGHHRRPAKDDQHRQNQEYHQELNQDAHPKRNQKYHHSPKQEIKQHVLNQEYHHPSNDQGSREVEHHRDREVSVPIRAPIAHAEIVSHPQQHEEDIHLLPPQHSAPIKVDPNQHVQPKAHPSPTPDQEEEDPRFFNSGAPIIQEQGKRIIIQEESPEELHMHQEQITAEVMDQEDNNEEDFEKAYKNAAYGFPAFEKKTENIEKDIYDPASYGFSRDNDEFNVEKSPFQQYQAEGDHFPKTARLNYNKARDATEQGYLLDYAINKPESVADRFRNKANYYKLYEQYKPEKYFASNDNSKNKEKQRERYTAAPSYSFGQTPKPKTNRYFAQYKTEPIKYEYDYSKGTPRDRDNSAHASIPYQRLKSKTLFVEPQFQYGFDPISLPQLLDSELAAMASNHNPESEKPGMRKKIYEENWYIKKTSTAGGKPS